MITPLMVKASERRDNNLSAKLRASIALLVLASCSTNEPKVVIGFDEHSTWKNTYPITTDTTFFHHEAYYPDGKLLHRVDYLNGKRHGFFQAWDSAGKEVRSGRYEMGKREGPWQIFDDTLLTQRVYADDQLEGPAYEELKDGRIVHGQYANGKEAGVWVWVKGNHVEQIATYRAGSYHGISRGFWPNGVKQMEANYDSDTIVGPVHYWDSLGRPSTKADVGYAFSNSNAR